MKTIVGILMDQIQFGATLKIAMSYTTTAIQSSQCLEKKNVQVRTVKTTVAAKTKLWMVLHARHGINKNLMHTSLHHQAILKKTLMKTFVETQMDQMIFGATLLTKM